jgi:hypothetical protein
MIVFQSLGIFFNTPVSIAQKKVFGQEKGPNPAQST